MNKRHTAEEVVAKLTQADAMAARGALQTDIARTLGISVMTYHRWRKHRPAILNSGTASGVEVGRVAGTDREGGADRETLLRLTELKAENARLRRLVTDLLLEKLELEEIHEADRLGSMARP